MQKLTVLPMNRGRFENDCQSILAGCPLVEVRNGAQALLSLGGISPALVSRFGLPGDRPPSPIGPPVQRSFFLVMREPLNRG